MSDSTIGRRGQASRAIRKYGMAYLFIAPPVVSVLVFLVGPMLTSLWWSFNDYSGLQEATFVGLANYRRLFSDPIFLRALANTTAFVLMGMSAGPALGMATALMLNQKVRLQGFFRTAYFLPVMTSFVVIATIWRMLYSENGIINYAIGLVGLAPVDWLGDPSWALVSIAVASVWQGFGFETVLFLAALQDVPKELQEAAMLDGAGSWRRFLAVTLPHLKPVIVYAFLVGIIGSYQVFDQVYVMTQGGPMNSTISVVYYLFKKFGDLRLGYASAVAYVLFVILVGLSYLQWKLFGKEQS
jgi:ABC-type sugar transport systems, permease components